MSLALIVAISILKTFQSSNLQRSLKLLDLVNKSQNAVRVAKRFSINSLRRTSITRQKLFRRRRCKRKLRHHHDTTRIFSCEATTFIFYFYLKRRLTFLLRHISAGAVHMCFNLHKFNHISSLTIDVVASPSLRHLIALSSFTSKPSAFYFHKNDFF